LIALNQAYLDPSEPDLVYLDLGDIQMAFEEHEQLTGQNKKDLAFQLLDKIQLQIRQAS